VHSHDPLVVADGRFCSGASREHGYEPCTQDAASRSAYGTSPEDALDERDPPDIGPLQDAVKEYFPNAKRCRTQAICRMSEIA
jgi:hypothetical protein